MNNINALRRGNKYTGVLWLSACISSLKLNYKLKNTYKMKTKQQIEERIEELTNKICEAKLKLEEISLSERRESEEYELIQTLLDIRSTLQWVLSF